MKTKEIEEARKEYSSYLFGSSENHSGTEIEQELLQPETVEVPKKSNSGKWVVISILTIIALSGGVWTAIGVFLLAVIIIQVFNSNK